MGDPIEHARVVQEYEVRFVRPEDVAELTELYHIARIATANQGGTRHKRMVWAAARFAKDHPYVSASGAYKDLDGLTERWR